MALDPGGNSSGITTLEVIDHTISIKWFYNIVSPSHLSIEQKNIFMAHIIAVLIAIEKPHYIVSEKPWGMGQSKDSLTQLIGAIKAELWTPVEWQIVSEARKIVAENGSANKIESGKALLNWPFDAPSRRIIKTLLYTAEHQKDPQLSLDILDSLVHGVAFIAKQGLVQKRLDKKSKI